MTPQRKALARALDAEAQAERGGEKRLLRRLRLNLAVLLALIGRREILVGVRLDLQPPRGEQTDEIPIARLLVAREELRLSTRGAEQITLDEADKSRRNSR